MENKDIENIKINDTVVGTFQYSRNFGFVVPDNKKLRNRHIYPKKVFWKSKK